MDEYYTEGQVSEMAQKILTILTPKDTGATILCLQGDLGAGKTTLTQAIIKALGSTETVVSPTFVIAKNYQLHESLFSQVIHMDAYRIDSFDELGPLRFEEWLQSPNTLLVIEWPERIKQRISEDALWLSINHHGDNRHIVSTDYEKEF